MNRLPPAMNAAAHVSVDVSNHGHSSLANTSRETGPMSLKPGNPRCMTSPRRAIAPMLFLLFVTALMWSSFAQAICSPQPECAGNPINSSAFVSQNVPATMKPGVSYTVSIQVTNNGSSTWTTAKGYALGSANPYNNTTWGLSRVALPSSISPGQTATFTRSEERRVGEEWKLRWSRDQ